MTAVDSSVSPKQQFILASPDGTGTGKVILAAPEASNTKQLIFTTTDNIVPGRIQVNTRIKEECILTCIVVNCLFIDKPNKFSQFLMSTGVRFLENSVDTECVERE